MKRCLSAVLLATLSVVPLLAQDPPKGWKMQRPGLQELSYKNLSCKGQVEPSF